MAVLPAVQPRPRLQRITPDPEFPEAFAAPTLPIRPLLIMSDAVPRSQNDTAARPAARLSGVKGMNDLLPEQMERWERLEHAVAAWARSYGYRQIRTPIVEPTALFKRGIGEVTDIVEKNIQKNDILSP